MIRIGMSKPKLHICVYIYAYTYAHTYICMYTFLNEEPKIRR